MSHETSNRPRGLDNVAPLQPGFTTHADANNSTASRRDDPLKYKEQEAKRMAQVLKGLAEQKQARERDERKAAFLAKRGRPAPALTPTHGFVHKAEVEARAYEDDLRIEQERAQKKAHAVTQRDMRKAAFIAHRKGAAAPEQRQTPQPSQAVSHVPAAKDFTRARAESLTAKMTRATQQAPAAKITAPARTSFARTIDL